MMAMVVMNRWLWAMMWVVSCAWLYAFSAVSWAQIHTTITPDGTLGTEVIQHGNVHEITGGKRPGNGPNLFHSFDRFDVGTGDTAHFIGQPRIENIIGRVTGGNASMIDGTLQSDATLFLLNPQGMVFGPNATLGINGSFYMSTADELHFEDDVVFEATYETQGLLSMAAPQAFGFLAGPAGDITIEGSRLTVPSGETLGITGGHMTIEGGRLRALSGTLSLTSIADVAAPAEAPLSAAGMVASKGMKLGHVTITGGTALEADGDGGGLVAIRSGRLTVAQATVSADNDGNVDRDGASIDIDVTDAFNLRDDSVLSVISRAAGRGGDVIVSAGTLAVTGGSAILTQSRNSSIGGRVDIRAERIQLAEEAVIRTDARNRGRGGDVVVSAGILDMTGGSAIFTQSRNSSVGGRVDIRAERVRLADAAFVGTEARGVGPGGQVSIVADEVSLLTNAQIVSNTSLSDSRGGDIVITANHRLRITDTGGDQTGIFAQGSDAESKNSNIEIDGGALIMDGGVIGTPASERTVAGATAGNISIAVERLHLKGGAAIDSSTLGGATGGNISIKATEAELSEGATIVAGTRGDGNAGTIRIEAQELLLQQQSTVMTAASQASGGAIVIAVHRLRLQDSQVTAAVQGKAGTLGGDIDIDATGVVTLRNSSISASANEGQGGNIGIVATESLILNDSTVSASAGIGQGGRIDIETGVLLQDARSTITATAGPAGIDGVVGIRALTTDVSGSVTALPRRFASTSPLSDVRCAQRLRGGLISSFVVAGRAGLPVDPSGGLPSFLVDVPQKLRLVDAGQPFVRPTAMPTVPGGYPCPKERPRVAQR